MPPDDLYQRWKARRTRGEVPAGFADGVMNAVVGHESRRQRTWLARLLLALTASRAGRVGLMAVAALVFALRLAAIVAVFLPNLRNPLE